MSRAYTAARVEMIEQSESPQARQEEDVPILFLHDIERHYRQGEETLHVLSGTELALWAGQSVALVAPSGAGKSTLLHIAGLLEHADHGDVYIEGRSTAILSDHERTRIRRNEIGFVYQSHHLLPEFSALENVLLPQMIRELKRTEAKTRAVELLEYLGLGGRLNSSAVRTLRRRTTACGDRPCGCQRPAHPVGRRTNRKPRPAHRRACLQRAVAVGEGLRPRCHHRDPQHGPGGPHGPARDLAGRQDHRDGVTPSGRVRSHLRTIV